MKNKKAEEVINRIMEENKVRSIKILGDEENKDYAFKIILTGNSVIADKEETYHGIKNKTIDLLKEADIKFQEIK